MSEDVRKNLRTQGKYNDVRFSKNRDKKQKNSISPKDTSDKRYPKRNSEGSKGINSSLSDDGASLLEYEGNSDYTFRELEEVEKPVEIKGRSKVILDKTINGESMMFYEPNFLLEDEGDEYFDRIYETIHFDARNIVIHGVEYPQPRLVAWFGPFEYKYSGTTLEPAEMPDVVLEIKEKVEKVLKSNYMEASFNSVLINLYRDGKDSVAWHSDDELMLGISPTIASVSLGETRKFEIRPRTRNHDGHSPSDTPTKYFVHLTHGSLIVMSGAMQDDWQHRVPKEYHDKGPRINLTFRRVYPLEKVIHLKKARYLRRKSWNKTPRKKIRLGDFASPSNSSCSKDADESYDDNRSSNCSFSSSFDTDDLSFSEKQSPRCLYMNDEETCVRRRKIKLSDDTDAVKKVQSPDCQILPTVSQFTENSGNTCVDSFVVKQKKNNRLIEYYDNCENSLNENYVPTGNDIENDQSLDRNDEDSHSAAMDSGVKSIQVAETASGDELPNKNEVDLAIIKEKC